MLQAPEGAKLVAFNAVVHRADGKVENLGLIDHSHAWLFSENELRAMCHAADHLENLMNLRRLKEPGAVIVPTFDKQVFSARMIGSSPSTAEPLNIGFGQGNPAGTRITALTSDKGLAGEIVANGAQSTRVVGTSSQQTTTNANDTYQVVGTITCNLGGGLSIVEAALFTGSAFPAQTTITNNPLSSGGTSITVTAATGFPGSGSYDCQLEQEVVTVTAGQGTTTWTVTRAVNGSSAASHNQNALITDCSPSGTGAGYYMAAKGDFALISLASADTLQLTASIQFT